jgi:hypothetical protein
LFLAKKVFFLVEQATTKRTTLAENMYFNNLVFNVNRFLVINFKKSILVYRLVKVRFFLIL